MSPTHWLIVVGVFLVLFGARKLPDLARSVGQSTRILRGEMRELTADGDERASTAGAPRAAAAPEGGPAGH
ncbi:Sec-independent protein translocase subunit TatA [Pseudonocardia spinosispora]|uniref:Sec-independent protein translocase subunit TatA n=1 Tax=Pseudonocardia spinosispora TaxID=103441 RepID=UPI001FE0D0A6|nr:Sec-independent protein translocase subunit TatA [Pseudonocardia spinosispora]